MAYSDTPVVGPRLKPTFSRLALALVAGVFSLYSAPCLAKRPCVEYFAQMAKAIDREVLSIDDIAKIEKILRDTNLSAEQAVDQAFGVYVDARLADVGDEIAEPLRKLLKERLKVSEKNLLGSHYNLLTQSIHIVGPPHYVQSAGGLRVRAHEFEHALIDQTHRTLYGRSATVSPLRLHWSQMRFQDELAAMRAEWNMLQAVPVDIRQKAIDAIESDPKLNKSVKAYMMRAMQNASFDRESYIAAEHAAGRYSQRQLLLTDISNKALLGTLSTTLVVVSSTYTVKEFCLWKTRDLSFDRKTDWYEKMCAQNMFVRDEIRKQKIESEPDGL